jgi:glycerophosphoryl diester phosphodiesterase
VELDVRTTRDGVVVVLHDLDLQRVTAGRDVRHAIDLDAADLLRVELEGGARVPTLADVLDWADASGLLVNVELKHDAPDLLRLTRAVARLLRGRRRVASRVLLSSFEPRLLAYAAALVPEVPRAYLFHEKQRHSKTFVPSLIARGVSAIALHPERTLCTPGRLADWRRAGHLVNVWTVNDPREARDLARLGVDAIITDTPANIRDAVAELR